MVQKLDDFLKGFAGEADYTDYWYDEGFSIAQDILDKFEDTDWEQLMEILSDRNTKWKQKLAYCLDDEKNSYQLKILLQFLESEDKELIELTVDSLRTFINQKNKSILLENSIYMDQIKNLYKCSGIAVKGIIEDLLKKMEITL